MERSIVYDNIKGIGIILMITGHIVFDERLWAWIYSFHMPLFFIITGVLTKTNNVNITYLFSKFKKILFPYISFVLISYLFSLIYMKQNVDISILVNIFTLHNGDLVKINNYPLWYFSIYFIVVCIYFFIQKCNKYFNLVFFTAILVFTQDIQKLLSAYIDSSGLAVIPGIEFLFIGRYMKKYLNKNIFNINCVIMSIVLCISFWFTKNTSFNLSCVGDWKYYVIATLMFYYVYVVSSNILKCWITWVGCNSLYFLGISNLVGTMWYVSNFRQYCLEIYKNSIMLNVIDVGIVCLFCSVLIQSYFWLKRRFFYDIR